MGKDFKLNLKGLDCANCANKIEERQYLYCVCF